MRAAVRRTTTALAVAACLAVTGCASDASTDPTAERSGPETLAPEDLGADTVDLDEVQGLVDDLRTTTEAAEPEIRDEMAPLLEQAQSALDQAGPAREDGDEAAREEAVGALEDAVSELEAAAENSDDEYGRAITEVAERLRRLAEELRPAPA